MKIDNAIRDFVEGVNRDALAHIDALSSERGFRLHGTPKAAFTMKESCDKFATYLEGYANYKVGNLNNPKASTQEAILESTDRFIASSELFQECSIQYAEIPAFIQSYITGVKTVMEAVDKAKSKMQDADVDPSDIGAVNEFTDKFMDRLHEHFKPWMEKVLWESGYMAKQRLSGKKQIAKKESKPVFL